MYEATESCKTHEECSHLACMMVAEGRIRVQDDGRTCIPEPAWHGSDRHYRVHLTLVDHPSLRNGLVFAIFHGPAYQSWRLWVCTVEEALATLENPCCFNYV